MRPATGTAVSPVSDLARIVAEHAVRGARLHVLLRFLLVAFVAVTVLWEPPQYYATECRLLAAGYVVWAIGVWWWFRRDPEHMVRLTWLVLTADLLLFGVVNQLAGVSDELSWTPYILVNGFLLLPLLAAAQLRPMLGVAIGVGTTVLYLASSIGARDYSGSGGDAEPWSSVVMRTFVVAGVATGAVLISNLQRGRVADIARLAGQRADLLAQLGSLEDRQRRDLAEALHDGALQYLLGARLELEDARDTGDTAAFDRVDEAILTSTRLLRATVSELHPAVLATAGLAQALRDLGVNTAARSRLQVDVTIDPPDDGGRDTTDLVVYSAVREMLANVVKHAEARKVTVAMVRRPDEVSVTVSDDGIGIADGALQRRLAAGHIGVASHRLRLEAAGGNLKLAAVDPHGTVATVVVPTGK